MSTTSNRLGLVINDLADRFRLQDFLDNWNTLDANPGVYICTSTTRPNSGGSAPAWDNANEGQAIYETDTNLYYTWDGASFVRRHPLGLLERDTVSANTDNTGASYQTLLTASVTFSGGRWLQITAHGPQITNGSATPMLGLFRGGTLLQEWSVPTGGAVSMTILDQPTVGAHVYTLKFKASSGTTTAHAAADNLWSLSVVEV